MNTPQRASSRVGWRVLAATPAMIGSLLLLVFLSGAIAPWGPIATLIWLCIGLFTLTRAGEAAAARLLCRFRRLDQAETSSLSPVVIALLDRCGLDPGSIDLYKVNSEARNAFATGKRSIALTTRLIADHHVGAISDRTLSSILCHEVGHLIKKSVRLAPITKWLAMPWRASYRLGARIVFPIAARQPRYLFALVVIAVFSIAIGHGIDDSQWGSAAILAGIAISVLAVPAIDAATSRDSEYAADQFAAQAGYGDDLSHALVNIDTADSIGPRVLCRHPRTAHRVQRLRLTSAIPPRSV